jgi:hypothetical protein
MDGSHTPNTPDILNTIVNLTSGGGPLFSDYTPPPPTRMAAPPLPPQYRPMAMSSLAQPTMLPRAPLALPDPVLPSPAAYHPVTHQRAAADNTLPPPPQPTLYPADSPVHIQSSFPVTTSPIPPMYPQKPSPVLLASPAYSDTSGTYQDKINYQKTAREQN